jgi:adenylate kinase
MPNAMQDGRPEIVMPPLSAPPECTPHLETRADDTEPIVRRRFEVRVRGRVARLRRPSEGSLGRSHSSIAPSSSQPQSPPPPPLCPPPVAQVYKAEAQPVEGFFRRQGLLQDFEITAGIPQTLPHLLALLQAHVPRQKVGRG